MAMNVEALRERRERLNNEAESIRQIVERDRATLKESEQALQHAVRRVDEIDVEIRSAASAS